MWLKDSKVSMAQKTVVCLGENYTVINYFYKDMSFFMTEEIKEKMKKNLPKEIIENHTEECLYFF